VIGGCELKTTSQSGATTILRVVVLLEMTVVLPEIVVEQRCGRQVIPHSF
jgi:hypothetical protein